MTQNDTEPLLKAAWIASSIGALDAGTAAAGLVETMPSAQLFGPEAGTALAVGYCVAGAVSIATDLSEL